MIDVPPAEFYDVIRRFALITLLMSAAVGKLHAKSWLSFKQTILRTAPIPIKLVPFIGIATVGAEFGAVYLLAAGAGVLAYVAAAALLLAFLTIVAMKVIRGDDSPCGCFGPDDKTTATLALVRNGCALAACLTGLVPTLGVSTSFWQTPLLPAVGIGVVAGTLLIHLPRSLSKTKENA